MTMTERTPAEQASAGEPRLLPGEPDPSYSAHRQRLGPLPTSGRELIEVVGSAGLRGRGGARFPTARKMAAVAAAADQRGPAVLIANGTEGEPLSGKDRALLVGNPHLVLDGMAAAAAAVGATRVVLAVEASRPDTVSAVRRALAERPGGPEVELALTPSCFVVGQETALVNWINAADARPVFGSRPFNRGVGGRPTLVDNVETLAHVGLIARFGSAWFRAVGPGDEPGSTLVTVTGGVGRPGVYEIPVDYPLVDLLAHVEADPAQALLIGGYFGAWISPQRAQWASLSTSGLAGVGAAPGAGVIVAVPTDACAWSEVVRVAGWYSAHSAGQCGPCQFGLADIARAASGVANGDDGAEAALRRWAQMVRGRGACHLPDGAATFVETALEALAPEVADHRRGQCRRRVAGYLPTPPPGAWR
jgi:NADH:ubiquinone oxidoreductase subunit F (NADH-binding)